jgi:outer membrane protein assembly factor BamB/mono/diheme cytochrome c family protein
MLNRSCIGRFPGVVAGLIFLGMFAITAFSQTAPVQMATGPSPSTALSERDYDWLQFGGDPEHNNFNQKEYILSPSSAAGLKQLWQVALPDPGDSAPVFLSAVRTKAGLRDVVFVVTQKAHLLAYDAHSGDLLWQNSWSCCRSSEAGPAIDPDRNFIYVFGTDGYIHKTRIFDGIEVTTGGWPELAGPPQAEMGYSLGIATARDGATYLYANSSQGIGHVTTINLKDGTQHVFNFRHSDSTEHLNMPGAPMLSLGAAVWGRAGAVYDPATDRIYVGTGTNSTKSPLVPDDHIWGDSLLALLPNGTSNVGNGYPLDSYTATNWMEQKRRDQDLGSTDPLILPTLPGARYPHLAVLGGKDGVIRVLNMDDLSGKGGAGHTGGELYLAMTPQGRSRIMTQPALWINPSDNAVWVIFTSDSGISALKMLVDGNGGVSLQPMWQHATGVPSNHVVANGVVYYADGGGQSDKPSGTLFALNALTGDVLWSTSIGSHHWASPIIANGMIYNMDRKENGRLTAYGLVDQPQSTLVAAASLPVSAMTPGVVTHEVHDPNESDGPGFTLEGKQPGDFVTFTVNIPQAGNYNVKVRVDNWKNRGIWQLTTDNVNRGSADQFSPWATSAEIDLGNFVFDAGGDHSFTFTVRGKNAASEGYWIVLDYIRLAQLKMEHHPYADTWRPMHPPQQESTPVASSAQPRSVWNGVYSGEQAQRGKAFYKTECGSCHGKTLEGDDAPALEGSDFLDNWYGRTVGDLFSQIRASMPKQDPGRLTSQQKIDIAAYILSANQFPTGKADLSDQAEIINRILIEAKISSH